MDIQQALTDAVAASMATIEQSPAPQVAAEPQDVDPQDPPTDDTPDTPETPEADPAPDEDAADEATDAPVLPEGYVAVPVVADQLATEFVLRDAEGEVEIPALIVEYKANGKVRQDRLDQVVKLAQFGVYNEAREQQFKQAESRLEELWTK